MYAKSIGELQLWIQRSVSPKFRLSESLSETKNDVTFWLIQTFGLTSNLGLGESLSERLIQKVKLPEKVQKKATKITPELRHLPYTERLKVCKLPTLRFRQVRGDMIEMYKT